MNSRVKNARNVAIVLLIAAAVYLLPGGRVANDLISNALSIGFLALLAWFVARLYRQKRIELLSLPDTQRGVIYFGVGAFALLLTAL